MKVARWWGKVTPLITPMLLTHATYSQDGQGYVTNVTAKSQESLVVPELDFGDLLSEPTIQGDIG